MSKRQTEIVHIEWYDPAFSTNGWQQKADLETWIKEGAARSDSFGLKIYEDKHIVVLAQSVGETQVADCVKITRSAIKKITVVGKTDISVKLKI